VRRKGEPVIDSDGNECELPAMCRREPEWAANRIAVMTTELTALRRIRDLVRERVELGPVTAGSIERQAAIDRELADAVKGAGG
jgi:hypothetical protein